MKAFLFGLGLGISMGVLFAPMSGQETRDNIAERANDLANSGRDMFEQGRDRVQRGVSAIRNVGGSSDARTGTEGV
jgi:gas vesicle protein